MNSHKLIDWDDAFDNSGYVPGSKNLLTEWMVLAKEFRSARERFRLAKLNVQYGKSERELMDLFQPKAAPKGTIILIHGGFWHMLSKDSVSHLAAGLLENGWAVAIPSYPLAPDARILEITMAIKACVEVIGELTKDPIRIVGHSAGGHLASRMACTGVLSPALQSRIQRIVSISGVHDLRPLVETKMNEKLRLTVEEALQESPANLDPVLGIAATFWVGAEERPEFLRQNRLAAECWGLKVPHVSSVYATNQNHFTVVDDLCNPSSALVAEILR